MVDNGRYVCPLNADTDGCVAAWNCNATPLTLLPAAMTGAGMTHPSAASAVFPAPTLVTIDPTTQTGAGAGKYQYYAVNGTDWRDTAITETLSWNNNEAATAKTTTLYFKALTSIVYTEAGGSTSAGNTDVGYVAATQWIVPLRTTQFAMQVDTLQVKLLTDLTANPPTALTAAWAFPPQTIVSDWVYKPGGYLYFVPNAAASAGDCVRFQCWRY
jgi:hypothetical protein